MSHLSKSRRSARNAARNLRNISRFGNGRIRKIKPIPTFLEYCLTKGNVLVIGDIENTLPQFKHRKNGYISNNIFKCIRADKIGLFYSIRQKMFMWLAINDDYTIYILHKDTELKYLPNIDNINIEKYQIIQNANRLFWSVYNVNDILDLTGNPIIRYKVGEIFKR